MRLDTADGDVLRVELERLRDAFDVPAAFPPEVVAEAEASSVSPSWPELDATDIEFCTIDPAGARDLDQALHVSRLGQGYRVRYAIADVAAFVTPGGLVDREAHRRGETLYFPDLRVPLHPPVLSGKRASLLPGEVRPALLWTIDVDAEGEPTESTFVELGYAVATSSTTSLRRRCSTPGPTTTDSCCYGRSGCCGSSRSVNAAASTCRWQSRRSRRSTAATHWFRAQLPIERWNAQISLLTGMSAAELMLYGDIGKMPEPLPTRAVGVRAIATCCSGVGCPLGRS